MKNIDEVLDRYFEGNTSLKEEEQLRTYFRKGNIDDQYKIYEPMFVLFEKERSTAEKPKKKKRFFVYLWTGVAASLLLITISKFVFTHSSSNQSQSIVYIDGKEVSDINTINSQALISIENVSSMDEDIINSQIGVLDSFTD